MTSCVSPEKGYRSWTPGDADSRAGRFPLRNCPATPASMPHPQDPARFGIPAMPAALARCQGALTGFVGGHDDPLQCVSTPRSLDPAPERAHIEAEAAHPLVE